MKILPVGAKLFHVDRRTGMKLIVAFRNFANAPKEAWKKDTASCVHLRIRNMALDLYAGISPNVQCTYIKCWVSLNTNSRKYEIATFDAFTYFNAENSVQSHYTAR